MSKKKTAHKSEKPKDKSQDITIQGDQTKSYDRQIAELAASGLVTNARMVVNFSAESFGKMSLTDSYEVLQDAGKLVNQGDLEAMERILTAQVISLDTIFCSMAHRAQMNIGHFPDAVSKYMNLALRAQSQCRSTVEALAEIKNPKPYIQNNKAQYQQVNNGTSPPDGNYYNNTRACAHTGENPKQTNELLENKTYEQEWLDTGTPETAGRTDTELETVGAKHRAEE